MKAASKTLSFIGSVTALLLTGLVGTLIICTRMNLPLPIKGETVFLLLLMGSPLFLLFQIFTIVMTRISATSGVVRIALYAINIIGALVASLLVFLLIALWRIGPINPR